MKTTKIKRNALITLLLSFIGASFCACNSDSKEEPTYSLSSSTAVTSFRLKPDKKVMTDLDSVYFSIDLERGVIFNADSLPMGTNVSKLVPQISIASGCTAARIRMSGGTIREGETDYLTTPGDSIDFTGDVTLTLTAQDGTAQRSYRLKVNVHKVKPDSLTFAPEAATRLPSRLPGPAAQKTVETPSGLVSLIRESDGSYTISKAPAGGEWTKTPVSLPFAPDVRSMAASGQRLFILAASGEMYSSSDGLAWTSEGVVWKTIIGDYAGELLGIRDSERGLLHTSLSGKYPEIDIEDEFPVSDLSNFLCLTNRWALEPTGILTGGADASGQPVTGTWGFDGLTWAHLSDTGIPALKAPAIVPYFIYKKTSAMWLQSEFSVLMAFGGQLADGSVNPDTYISMNNGVSWSKAPANLSLPEAVEPTFGADALILSVRMKGNLSDALSPDSKVRRRLNYDINGYEISWDCPYIHIFGGTRGNGTLSDLAWCGVLARLTFIPLL